MSNASAFRSDATETRAATRLSTKLDALLRDRTGRRCAVSVVDLSLTGFRAETVSKLHPGTLVWVTLPGLQGLEATIAWQRGEHIGAAFVRPLYAAVFDHIVRLAQ